MAKVSVVIPSFNHAAFLRQAIAGVLSQTFDDWELVLVDDASSDDSLDIARSHSDPRIKVFSNENNLGTYGTLNRCLDLSEGDYIAVLNSDDTWHPNKLAAQVAALDENRETSFSYTFGTTTHADGTLKHDGHHQGLPSSEIQQPIASLLIENRILASSVVFRRGLTRFAADVTTSGDWVALLRLCRLGKAAFVDEPLTFWRHHPANTSRDRVRIYPEEVKVRQAILAMREEWFLPGADHEAVRRGLTICAIRLHTVLAYVGEIPAAKEALRLALRLDPGNLQARKRLLAHLLPRSVLYRRLGLRVPAEDVVKAYRTMALNSVDLQVEDSLLDVSGGAELM